ncbi:MAG: amidohydrolase family protein [Gemmatimonadales bacterium]
MRTSVVGFVTLYAVSLGAQMPPSDGVEYETLVIRNALVIDGTANPVRGPYDITIEGGIISEMTRYNASREITADRIIDASAMYVMPGIIDMHGHIQFSRNGEPMPRDYVYKLWLAHGITTVRDPGSGEGLDTIVAHAELSQHNEISAPAIIPYVTFPAVRSPDEVRRTVRDLRGRGARGIKAFIMPPQIFSALMTEANEIGLPVAVDLKIQETDAMAAARAGIRSLEHWYGIPDAAIPGPQNFPADYNYDDELDRFRWAGDLWRQADPELLSAVLDTMVAHGVTWDPTFAVYEANRDLSRARNLPWFEDYALPNLLDFFEPDPARHGSYHLDWTTADEIMWRNNFRIWMHWIREYAARGGNVTIGSDAGFIYHLYGFGTIREMELHQEAGFHPLEVIRQATANGAAALGLSNTGIVRVGYEADLAIVSGNPLHNLKLLYGTGIERVSEDGEIVRAGGVRYTVKDGIVFDAHELLRQIREMVAAAKRARVTAP